MREVIQSTRERITRAYPAVIASGLFAEVPITSSRTPPTARIAPSPRPDADREKRIRSQSCSVDGMILRVGDARICSRAQMESLVKETADLASSINLLVKSKEKVGDLKVS
jgi:hypothetical protein